MGRQVVEIIGDTSGLVSAYDEAAKLSKGFDGKIKSIGSSLSKTGKDLTLKFTAPLALAAGFAFSTAIAFDDSMRKVQAVTGATGDQFDAMTQKAQDLGSTTAFSAWQAATAMQYLGMAGLDTNEILQATPQMLSLASAGALDLGVAADISTNVLSGFNLQVDDLGHVSDILAQAAATANTSVGQLGTAMAYVGPVASAADKSIEETTAAIQIMSNAGIQGSMAGTSLRGSLTALLSPTKQATDILGTYGLTAADVDPQVHSLAEIIDTLGAANLSTADTMTIFGDRAGPGMIALLTAGGDTLRDYTGQLQDCDGAAQKMADTMEGGYGGKLRQFRSTVEGLNISFGGLIAEALLPAMEATRSLASWLTDLDDGTKNAIITTGLFTAALGPTLWATGALAGGVGNLIGLYRTYQASTFAATVATKGFTAALAANPIGLAIIGVTTLAAVLLPLIASTQDATDATEEYNDALEKTLDLTKKTDEELEKGITNLEKDTAKLKESADMLRSQYHPALLGSTLAAIARTEAEEEQAIQLYKTEVASRNNAEAYRRLADGAETAYKDASMAVNAHRQTVSDLQTQYDDLKSAIDEALGINEEIEDQDREVERADIHRIRAQQDLSDLNQEIKDKEQEMRDTDYGSYDTREKAERDLSDLKLRHREATLNLADAQDTYTDALEEQTEIKTRKTELDSELDGESILSAQNRLEKIGEALEEETEKLEGALVAQEKAQAAHDYLMNQNNIEVLNTKSENHAEFVKFLHDNPGIVRTYHVEYDSEGNMIGGPPQIPELTIQTPEYQELELSQGLSPTQNAASNNPTLTTQAPAQPPAQTGGDVNIGAVNVYSPKADAPTMAFETKRALRDFGSRGSLI